MNDKQHLRRLARSLKESRNFPANTCGASRHTQIIGECLAKRRPYPMLEEEPEHCAISLLSTVDTLYRARTNLSCLMDVAQAAVDEHAKGYRADGGFDANRQIELLDQLGSLLDAIAQGTEARRVETPLATPSRSDDGPVAEGDAP